MDEQATNRRATGGLLIPLVLAAVFGGAISAAAVVAIGGSDASTPTTVTVRDAAAAGATTVVAAATAAPTAAAEKSVAQIYAEAAPGVVRVTQGQGQGSGFVIDNEGHILTNAHVVSDGGPVFVSFSNDDRVEARIVGKDESTDTALLAVDSDAAALRPIPLGTSATVGVGDPVVAIGNPFGLDRTITSGIVSAVARQIVAPNGFPINNAIQTDAAINHGNSGGPLLNRRGEVIGINSQIVDSGVNANVGVGFAIPIDLIKQIAQDLQDDGSVSHAWLGVSLAPVDAALAGSTRLAADHGAMIASIQPGSPAARAGLRAATDEIVLGGQTYAIGGDIVTSVEGKEVASIVALQNEIQTRRAGDIVTLTVARSGGETVDVDVTLGQQPTTAG